jgi:hypothetical protein
MNTKKLLVISSECVGDTWGHWDADCAIETEDTIYYARRCWTRHNHGGTVIVEGYETHYSRRADIGGSIDLTTDEVPEAVKAMLDEYIIDAICERKMEAEREEVDK